MKKFLTVLLVIAVMFTFSFGSAFAAYSDTELQNVVNSHEAAVQKITDQYNKNLALLNGDYAKKVADPQGGADKAAWTKACDAALSTAKAELNKQYGVALNALTTAENDIEKTGDIKGWNIGNAATEPGYVDVKAIIDTLTINELGAINADEYVFDAVKERIVNLVKNYDLAKFVTDDDVVVDGQKTGKSSYQTALEAQTVALGELTAITFKKDNAGATDPALADQIKAIEDIYNITGVGSAKEIESGTFYDKIKNLKTTVTLKTDEAKIAYAKNATLNPIKATIESNRASALKPHNDEIFKQSIATKPNQSKIDKANEEIAKLNKQYDALTKVWDYRLENGTYKVEKDGAADVINLYYGDKLIVEIGRFNADGEYSPMANMYSTLTNKLTLELAAELVAHVEDLEKQAATMKATIYVDGDVAIDVDALLADAIEETYMNADKTVQLADATRTNSAVHARAHQLLGTACPGGAAKATDSVTVNGKKYDSVAKWGNGKTYTTGNGNAVDDIVYDVTTAIKSAGTIAEAEAAFVAAYDKYAAVFTVTDQQKLFAYGGELYKKDLAAKADLKAYIAYKVALMDDAIPGVAAALNAYYSVDAAKPNFKDEVLLSGVNNAADLDAALASAKATVDSLKTYKAIKDEDKALRDKIVASARPATLARKAEILALYDEYLAFKDYATMVGYFSASDSKNVEGLIVGDVKNLANLEKPTIDAIKKEIDKDGKVTLEDRENVKAFVEAVDAYNDVYAWGYELVDEYSYGTYEDQIFELDVIAVNNQIAALPAYGATTAQIKAARDAVDALGFKGICKINKDMLTKLNRLEDSLGYEVEALKITASSTAKKGSITVKWTVKGNAAAADGYQIWKSTKKNSGYKKAFTTTKKSYKNTKGLKKGTRYYYKVRAYKVVDGKNVYSDWSNKAYRKAK